jgi:hypothetical protein
MIEKSSLIRAQTTSNLSLHFTPFQLNISGVTLNNFDKLPVRRREREKKNTYLDDKEIVGSSPMGAGLAFPSSARCCCNHVKRLSSTSM